MATPKRIRDPLYEERERVYSRIKRLHESVDTLRCERLVVDAATDLVCDEILDLLEQVRDRLPSLKESMAA